MKRVKVRDIGIKDAHGGMNDGAIVGARLPATAIGQRDLHK
jgi:hypothetical protein